MQKLFRNIFDVKKSEYTVTLLMFINIYLLLVTYYFLKPARDGLFISKIGWEQLPIVFILIAITAYFVNVLYSKAGNKLNMKRLINITNAALIASLFVLRWIIISGEVWAMYLFYIWVSIYGVLAISQFWLFANAVYTPTQAKRLFALLNLGAILGAWTGGEITAIVLNTFNIAIENLLFLCMGLLAVCIILNNTVWVIKKNEIGSSVEPGISDRENQREEFTKIVKLVKNSRHLMLIIGIISMTMATGTFVDTQFKGVTDLHFKMLNEPVQNQAESNIDFMRRAEAENQIIDDNEKKQMTGFFGKFYGRLSLISLLLQMLLTYRLTRLIGVSGLIMFLPLGLLLGSTFMLFAPGLLAGVLLRGSDGAFKYSMDKTGRELLFLPLPLDIKKSTKIFIDVVVDRGSRGFAGGLLLLAIWVGFQPQQLSYIVIPMLAIWLIFVLKVRKEYLNSFRHAIDKQKINPADLRINLNDPAVLSHLKDALRSAVPKQIQYALSMLGSNINRETAEAILPLLSHSDSAIRRSAISSLSNHEEQYDRIKAMTEDYDPEVRVEALNCVLTHTKERKNIINEYLNHNDIKIASTALHCVAKNGTKSEKELIGRRFIDNLLSDLNCDKNSKMQIVDALGLLQKSEMNHYIEEMINDSSLQLKKRAIAAAGSTGDAYFVDLLLNNLKSRDSRAEVRIALSDYGENIIDKLHSCLCDSTKDFKIRLNIPKIMSLIPTQHSINVLLSSLDHANEAIRFQILKALSKMRSRHPLLKINRKMVFEAFFDRTKTYYQILNILRHQKDNGRSEKDQLLQKALKEKLDSNLEQMFRILGLNYPPVDIFNAYQGVTSDTKLQRANAVEFLDNLLSQDLKKYILPILDPDNFENIDELSKKFYDFSAQDRFDGLKYLLTNSDPWIKACALYALTKDEANRLRGEIILLKKREEPILRETAELVSKQISQP